jgi:paired amphipathic helix protein Sin3a
MFRTEKDHSCFCSAEKRRSLLLKQVYIQVQALFKNEEDLLSEFKDFLPEITGTSTQQGGLVGIRPYPPDGPSGSGAMWSHESAATPSSAPKGTQPPSRRRKREQPKEPAPPANKQAEPARVSRTLSWAYMTRSEVCLSPA